MSDKKHKCVQPLEIKDLLSLAASLPAPFSLRRSRKRRAAKPLQRAPAQAKSRKGRLTPSPFARPACGELALLLRIDLALGRTSRFEKRLVKALAQAGHTLV